MGVSFEHRLASIGAITDLEATLPSPKKSKLPSYRIN